MNPRSIPGAIVIGCHVNGLGVIRSLAREGIPVIALTYDERADFAHVSRHVREWIRVPPPRFEEAAFIDVLKANAPRWKGALIVETNDDSLVAVSKHRAELESDYLVSTPRWEVVKHLIEKPATYRLAAECSVPHPRTWSPTTVGGLPEMATDIPFPCLVKPVVSHLFVAEFGVKNFRAADASQLRSMLERCSASGLEVMIQEIIPGPDTNIYQCLMHVDSRSGSGTAFFTRKLRQSPPGYGVARVAVSHAPIPEIEAWTLAMLRRIGFTGVAHAEFKRDARDGSYKLMEINGRLPRSNLLSTRCGLNFPLIVGRDLAASEPSPAIRYEEDVYWIELAMDLFVSARNFRSEALSVRDYLGPYLASRKILADWSHDDPRPFFARIGNVLHRGSSRGHA